MSTEFAPTAEELADVYSEASNLHLTSTPLVRVFEQFAVADRTRIKMWRSEGSSCITAPSDSLSTLALSVDYQIYMHLDVNENYVSLSTAFKFDQLQRVFDPSKKPDTFDWLTFLYAEAGRRSFYNQDQIKELNFVDRNGYGLRTKRWRPIIDNDKHLIDSIRVSNLVEERLLNEGRYQRHRGLFLPSKACRWRNIE